MISRRDILNASCAIGALLLVNPVEASLHGSAPQLSQRSVINLGLIEDNSYPFINFYLTGDGSTSPVGNAFASTTTAWTAGIDANGWPNATGVTGHNFGGSVRIPGSDEYTGKWVITWTGDGKVNLGTGTWTVDGSSTNFTQNSNGNYSNTIGSVPRIVVTLSALTGPQLIGIQFQSTDPNSTGAYLKNFKFYQLGDETDLNAGKVFRANYKQSLVNLNPSAIRFMNWHGSAASRICRFETRSLPTNAGYSEFTNWTASPVYPDATGTNLFSVATATPTTANPKTTPASLTHGEVAIFRTGTGAGSARSGGQYNITAITNASPAVITTSAAHGLNTGDTAIQFNMVGMSKLNYFPTVVTVIDATHYSIPVDTTTYGAFTSGNGTQYWSVNVGARGAKPLAATDGQNPASIFGATISSGAYIAVSYDKNVAVQSDGAGNMIFGAWTYAGSDPNNPNGWAAPMPLEIMTTLVNEVNAMSVAQGINNPVHMWLNIPHTALTSMDSDYTTGSDYAINAVGVVMNGANGYAGLTANAQLFVEYGNETWNSAGGFKGTFYLARMGALRWPASGTTDYVDMYVLRSTIVMRAIKANFASSRIKYVLSGQGFAGLGAGGLNDARINASSTPGAAGNYYLTDALASGFGTPISNHDVFATATYFDMDATYGAGQFITDSSTYAGGGAGQATAIASFVANIVSGAGQSINGYLNNSLTGLTATYAAALKALGKTAINYEGGPDWQTAVGGQVQSGHTITSADSNFLIAVLDSTQWRDAQVNYFNRTSQLAGSAMPSVYTFIGTITDQRWSYTKPDSFVGTTEGQGLLNSPVWVGMGSRNQGLSP